jgi:UDP-N-acetylglucosamine 2-epimerase (non-hydrolysing)
VVSRRLPRENKALEEMVLGPAVLVTTHRRESWGQPMARTANAIARLAKEYDQVRFVVPAHLNPAVREVLLPPLEGLDNVIVTEPLSYSDFARAMFSSTLILTDSGGVQEEAPSLGKPVLVLRETTERPEAVEAGTVRLVGTDEDLIVDQVSTLLTDSDAYATMAQAVNPYGDGHAASRIQAATEHFFGLGDRAPEWTGGSAGTEGPGHPGRH